MKIAIYAVFGFYKHGTTYAALNKGMLKATDDQSLVVPYIIRFPDDLTGVQSFQKELNIPDEATVLCRVGGGNDV